MAVAEIPAGVPGQPTSWWARFRKRVKDSRTAWLYILPAGLVMIFITMIPQLYQLYMAFTDYRVKNLRFILFNPETWEKYAPTFVGIENFVKIVTSQLAIENYDFWRLLLFNVTWTVANIIFHVTLGVAIALVLNNRDLIGKRFYRSLYVLPWAVPGYIAALTWRNMFDPRFGAFNLLLARMNELWPSTAC